jgi:hypothetical protein
MDVAWQLIVFMITYISDLTRQMLPSMLHFFLCLSHGASPSCDSNTENSSFYQCFTTLHQLSLGISRTFKMFYKSFLVDTLV